MALTKSQVKEILSAANVPLENMYTAITKIMEGHIASLDALREERDKYKVDAEKLPQVQKELDTLKATPVDDYKVKYESEHTALEELKTQIAKDNLNRQKSTLYRKLLTESGIDEKRLDAVLRLTDLDKIEIKDGKLTNKDALVKGIKSEWSDYIVDEKMKGASPATPPSGDPNTFENMSLAEKMKYANEHPTDAAVQNWLRK